VAVAFPGEQFVGDLCGFVAGAGADPEGEGALDRVGVGGDDPVADREPAGQAAAVEFDADAAGVAAGVVDAASVDAVALGVQDPDRADGDLDGLVEGQGDGVGCGVQAGVGGWVGGLQDRVRAGRVAPASSSQPSGRMTARMRQCRRTVPPPRMGRPLTGLPP
jgi:hypothetical protein